MKGIYITEYYISLPGVEKKIKSQIDIFNKNKLEVDRIIIQSKNKINKIITRLPFFYKKYKLENIEKYKYIYIRKPLIDKGLILELERIKKINNNIKILLEIPTYPYDKELMNLIDYTSLLKERIWRKKLHKYVDRIVTYSQDKYIYGIKTIGISNGINIKQIQPINPIKHSEINIIAVAVFSNWHGYDRFIKGMYNYYKLKNNQKVILHLVGEGNSLNLYKDMAKKYNIEDKIVFYGKKEGAELDDIYNKCDIALDAMGRHRSGVYYNSSLKGKEYAAKGIPIISGVHTELDNESNFKYYYRVPADESVINVEKVVEIYNNIYNSGVSREEIIRYIREYALNNFDMNYAFKSVIDYINNTI